MNIPNLLTLLRIVLVPALVLVFYLPFSWSYLVASAIFSLAAITDWLDGHLARSLGQTTNFGAFLDPVADKLMVVVALVLLIEEYAVWWFTLPALVIIGRELIVSALREWMAEVGQRKQVAVSNLGKWKTACQMTAIIILLAFPAQLSFFNVIGFMALLLASVLTYWTMHQYLLASAEHFK